MAHDFIMPHQSSINQIKYCVAFSAAAFVNLKPSSPKSARARNNNAARGRGRSNFFEKNQGRRVPLQSHFRSVYETVTCAEHRIPNLLLDQARH